MRNGNYLNLATNQQAWDRLQQDDYQQRDMANCTFRP